MKGVCVNQSEKWVGVGVCMEKKKRRGKGRGG